MVSPERSATRTVGRVGRRSQWLAARAAAAPAVSAAARMIAVIRVAPFSNGFYAAVFVR